LEEEAGVVGKVGMGKATAVSCANIALVKYWGNSDQVLRLPANASLSMNMAGLTSTTTVGFSATLETDEILLDGRPLASDGRARAVEHLDRVRKLAGLGRWARVVSRNSFPSGAGLASSAAGFAALTLAATSAAGLTLNPRELSALARLGSGSACRSLPGGFVEWRPAARHKDSYGISIAPVGHWALADVIAIVAPEHKDVGSTSGHALADTSPLQAARVESTAVRFEACKAAVLARDFERLAPVVELEALTMHAVMLTSTPPLIYWAPATLRLMEGVQAWRAEGLPVAFTIDAGPNVHCLCPLEVAGQVEERLRSVPGVQQVMRATPGGPARLVETHLF
jgi:diphosphomevalonate decarboxylase